MKQQPDLPVHFCNLMLSLHESSHVSCLSIDQATADAAAAAAAAAPAVAKSPGNVDNNVLRKLVQF